ncbi:HEAT repeat-containing protein 4 [Allomyces javanicus]|nr:HEAT repeat-containing protein 4 [Allomyces javanicus]
MDAITVNSTTSTSVGIFPLPLDSGLVEPNLPTSLSPHSRHGGRRHARAPAADPDTNDERPPPRGYRHIFSPAPKVDKDAHAADRTAAVAVTARASRRRSRQDGKDDARSTAASSIPHRPKTKAQVAATNALVQAMQWHDPGSLKPRTTIPPAYAQRLHDVDSWEWFLAQTSPPRIKSQRVDDGPGTVELAFAPDVLPAQPTSPNRRTRGAADATPPRRGAARKRPLAVAATDAAGQDSPADPQPPPATATTTTTTTMLPAARLSAIAGSDPALYTCDSPAPAGDLPPAMSGSSHATPTRHRGPILPALTTALNLHPAAPGAPVPTVDPTPLPRRVSISTAAPTALGATAPGRRRTLSPPPSRRNTGSPPGSRRASVDGRAKPAMRVAEGEAEGVHAIQSVLSDATQAMLAKLAVQQQMQQMAAAKAARRGGGHAVGVGAAVGGSTESSSTATSTESLDPKNLFAGKLPTTPVAIKTPVTASGGGGDAARPTGMPHPVLRVLCGTTARDIEDLLAPKARPGAAARWLVPSSPTSSLALSTPISARAMQAQLAATPAAITAQWRQSRALLGALVDAVQYGPAPLTATAATPTQPDALGPVRVAVDAALVRYRRADPATQARTLHNHRPGSVYAVVRDTTVAAPVKGGDGMMVASPTVEAFGGELPPMTAAGESGGLMPGRRKSRAVLEGRDASRRMSGVTDKHLADAPLEEELETAQVECGSASNELNLTVIGRGAETGYFNEASAFLAMVKQLGTNYRSANLTFETLDPAMPAEDFPTAVMELEATSLPNHPPPPNSPESQVILHRACLALDIGYPPLAQAAVRLIWVVTGGRLPDSHHRVILAVFRHMVAHSTVPHQRFAAQCLVRLGLVADPVVLAHLCTRLGDVDAPARAAALALITGVPVEDAMAVVGSVVPLLTHSNCRVRSDAVAVVAAMAARWRIAHPAVWADVVVGKHAVVAPDGGERYDALVTGSATAGEDEDENEERPSSAAAVAAPVIAATPGSAESVATTAAAPGAADLVRDADLLRSALQAVVALMVTDWHDPLRDQCAKVVADMDLLPLLMTHVATVLRGKDVVQRKDALRVLGLVRLVTTEAWEALIDAFRDDYLAVRMEACRTAYALALCHSQLLKEVLNRMSDAEPKVRSLAVRAVAKVATGPKVCFDILSSLISFLEHELVPSVKVSGCDAMVDLLGICDEAVSSFAAVTMHTTSSKDPSDGVAAEPVPLAPRRTGNQQHASHAHLVPSATSASAAASAASKHASRTDLLSAGSRHASRTDLLGTASPASRHASRTDLAPSTTNLAHADSATQPLASSTVGTAAAAVAAALTDRVRALLVKWYQSPYDEDRKLRIRAEAALTRMGVHVGSVTAAAAVVADDGAGDAAAVVKSVHRLASRTNVLRAIMAADVAAAAREAGEGGEEEEEDAAMLVADTAVLLSEFAARAGVAGVRPASPSISGAPLARRRASVAVDRRHPARTAGAGDVAKPRRVDSLRAGTGAAPDVMVTRDDEVRRSVPTALDRRPSRVTMALTPPVGMSRTVSVGSSAASSRKASRAMLDYTAL